MIVSNYLSLSCPCFMGGTPMPRGVLQEPQTKKFCGGKRYSARRRFLSSVSPRTARRESGAATRAQRGSCHRTPDFAVAGGATAAGQADA